MNTKLFATLCTLLSGSCVAAGQPSDTLRSDSDKSVNSAFDLTQTRVIATRNTIIFRQQVSGEAGAAKPEAIGKLPGSPVYSYVWPLSADSSVVGFGSSQGTLALVVTVHPDFDDTPLYDENGDGNKHNDGNEWHVHWVVLTGNEACGKGALKVKDIEPGGNPRLPVTAPGLPILLDSPGYQISFVGRTVDVRVPRQALAEAGAFSFDGVTADLQINEQGKNPLLCVVKVHDIASGDLSLPAKLNLD